ncbi:predicted protein [Uncinocarpus reesii 1704]|uniref:Uncharacterized protein n=1 Tax=Uncinocarpus reesii (strain UAMH 1704) TaxID=336963 RepID=C4JIP4_UNCRE|nr:uncharacterized protein UREG_02905 [Uncinocarpus reesii 1704]EEP78056.1 predicted protein [Uncinocarpus reesii 1704]
MVQLFGSQQKDGFGLLFHEARAEMTRRSVGDGVILTPTAGDLLRSSSRRLKAGMSLIPCIKSFVVSLSIPEFIHLHTSPSYLGRESVADLPFYPFITLDQNLKSIGLDLSPLLGKHLNPPSDPVSDGSSHKFQGSLSLLVTAQIIHCMRLTSPGISALSTPYLPIDPFGSTPKAKKEDPTGGKRNLAVNDSRYELVTQIWR